MISQGLLRGLPVLRDPRGVTAESSRALQGVGRALLRDQRDLPFLSLILGIVLLQLPFAAALFVPGVFRWWLAAIYLAVLFAVWFDRYTLMLHCTSHRTLFQRRYRLFNEVIPWLIGPVMGQPPGGYFCHHLGMHHPENNLEDDLSSTMPYERRSFLHFLRYWAIFMVTVTVGLPRYLFAHGRPKLGYKAFAGELVFFSGGAIGLAFAPRPTLVVFVIPFIASRFLMMWGNWGQHAFIDPASPASLYSSSITCINTRYNRRCFNDGYHIGHHLRPSRHWTELPGDLEQSAERYAREGAIVFSGIDFFQVSLYLFLKRWNWLADCYVELDGKGRQREEIIALLQDRTRPLLRNTTS